HGGPSRPPEPRQRQDVERPREAAGVADPLRPARAGHLVLHGRARALPRLDVDAGGFVRGHAFDSRTNLPTLSSSTGIGYTPSKHARHSRSAGIVVAFVSPSSEM